jgi:hypothetical protein
MSINVHIALVLSICYLVNRIECNNVNYELMYLVSTERNGIYQIGEKQQFKNVIRKGWVLESDKKYNIRLYVKYNAPVNSLTIGNHSLHIFFTTSSENCFQNNSRDDYYSETIDFDYVYIDVNYRLLQANIQLSLKYSLLQYHACLAIDDDEFQHQGVFFEFFLF